MKNLHLVLPPAGEAKVIGEEPTWSEKIKETDYTKELNKGLNWHQYCASDKNISKYILEWMKENRPSTFNKDKAIFAKISDKNIDRTLAIIARMELQGFPLNKDHHKKLSDYVSSLLVKEKKVKKENSDEKVEVKKPNVQDRMRAQVSGVLSDLDFAVDEAFDGKLPDTKKIIEDISVKGFKGPQLKIIIDHLSTQIDEWDIARNKDDEQLAEGYSYIGKRQLNAVIKSFVEIKDGLSSKYTAFKSQRIVRKRPVDKKKMASKIRYMVEDKELGIKSIDPVNLIGANMVWVYDTKKRLLGYYEAEAQNSIFIRGTMIDGYKVTCVKILRKPKDQLTAFMKLRKNQTVNFLDDIKAKCKTLNGRMTPNTIILRID